MMFSYIFLLNVFWSTVRIGFLALAIYLGYLVYSDPNGSMQTAGSAVGSAVSGFRHATFAAKEGAE